MSEKSELIAIKVPPVLKRRLETVAEIEGTTVSGFIRSVLTMVLEEVADFTPLGTIKLQKMVIWSTFSLLSVSLRNEMMLTQVMLEQNERIGNKEDVEVFLNSLKETKKEIAWTDEALNLISNREWEKLYEYIGKGF